MNLQTKAAPLLTYSASAIALALSFTFPLNQTSSPLGITAALMLALGSEINVSYKYFFLHFFIANSIACFWLIETITRFGGFPILVSFFIFIAFCVLSAGQGLFCCFLFKRLSKFALDKIALALPLSWFVSEFFYPKLFPWALAQTQINFKPFSSLADALGIYPLSLVLLWWACLVARSLTKRTPLFNKANSVIFAASALALFYGHLQNQVVENQIKKSKSLEVGIIQGNISTKQKGAIEYLTTNLEQYRKLSDKAVKAGAKLIIWPESVFTEWIGENTKILSGDKHPYPDSQSPLITGTLSFRPKKVRDLANLSGKNSAANEIYDLFNSSIAIEPSGNIIGFYHKKILMPFGEYLPFAKYFPYLKTLSPQTGDFTSGDLNAPLNFEFDGAQVPISLLICYEDMEPSLARDSVNHGGSLLIGLTNDAWYGDSAAPYEHHIISAWNAIKTRRFLVRSTNTGLTAIVNPLGETLKTLPIFKSDILVTAVTPLNIKTIYSEIGELPSYIIALISLFLVLKTLISKRSMR